MVPVVKCVSDSERQPPDLGWQRLDHSQQEGCVDRLGLLAGRGDGRVAGAELVAQPGGANPAGDGSQAAS